MCFVTFDMFCFVCWKEIAVRGADPQAGSAHRDLSSVKGHMLTMSKKVANATFSLPMFDLTMASHKCLEKLNVYICLGFGGVEGQGRVNTRD